MSPPKKRTHQAHKVSHREVQQQQQQQQQHQQRTKRGNRKHKNDTPVVPPAPDVTMYDAVPKQVSFIMSMLGYDIKQNPTHSAHLVDKFYPRMTLFQSMSLDFRVTISQDTSTVQRKQYTAHTSVK